MNEIDVQKEWSSLVEAYAGMSDEELCSLAEKAYELTDLAKQALTAELSARNIDANLVEQTPLSDASEEEQERDFDANDLDLVSIARVWDADEAARVMTPLRDAGIPAYLGPDNLEKVSDFHSTFDAGVEIRVRRIDEQRALRVPTLASPQPESEPEEEQPCVVLCPACKSDEIVFEELVAAASASDSTSTQKFRWKCDNCGHEWEDDGVEDCPA
jgi:DNA-directed RNA polymerase subunit M/transcription elongation factor TFIIS